ncbi:MAG: hypothetical protein LBT53_05400 [Puniceicoccales bacterium]|nr:hypothetical protein [Puniceicoccales bacterium]
MGASTFFASIFFATSTPARPPAIRHPRRLQRTTRSPPAAAHLPPSTSRRPQFSR